MKLSMRFNRLINIINFLLYLSMNEKLCFEKKLQFPSGKQTFFHKYWEKKAKTTKEKH